MSDAERCRENNWGPGTRLIGDEGYGPTVIEITAVGEESILAKSIRPIISRERTWTLKFRDWQVSE